MKKILFFLIPLSLTEGDFLKKHFGALNKYLDASTKLTVQLQVATAADTFNCFSKYPEHQVLLTYLKYPKLCTKRNDHNFHTHALTSNNHIKQKASHLLFHM